MADFKRVIITREGQKLMSDIIAGKKTLSFTRLIISEDDVATINDKDKDGSNYADENVNLNYFATINQETPELQVHTVESLGGMTNPSVEVIASVDNTQLTKGYYMKTLGLCAEDNSGNEILYAYTYADQPGYMPPYNGKTTSGAMFKITVTVGNTDQVNLLSGANYASSYEVNEIQKQLNDLQTIVGYNENDVFGLEADFENNQFTRLAGASNLTAGKDFDNLGPWKRKRCMVDYKTGNVVAYEGDPNFSETGKLANSTVVNDVTYSDQVPYAIMVEQPKFYYRVVPIKTTDNGNGIVTLDKARYYISSAPHIGFKVHPAFVVGGDEVNKIYLSSYTTGENDYVIDGQANSLKILDSNKTTTKYTGNPKQFEVILQNLLKLNPNWDLSSFKTYSMSMLLYVIEYGAFNKWTLQNPRSGIQNYRGEQGLDNGMVLFDRFYSLENGKITIFSKYSVKLCTATIPSLGYISKFQYNEKDDWSFYPVEANGNTTSPVGSYYNYGKYTVNGYLAIRNEPFSIEIIASSNNGKYTRLIYRG